MAETPNVLPQIIKATYDPGSAFPDMVADAKRAAGQVKSEFDKVLGGKVLDVSANSGVFAQLQRDASLLRAAIDPLYTAQQRFNAEMDRADNLLAAGAISQREYASATQMARDALQQANAALFQGADAAKAGTTANHMVVNSTRALRQASLQAGQQLQDVAISLYSGQQASVVLAQQLPQLAFAFTGLEGSANKTQDRIGRFATFLSGPWGLAVGLAAGALASYVYELVTAGDETEKTEKKQRAFLEVMQDAKASYEELAQAAKDYADQQIRAREVTILGIQAEAAATAARLKSAIAIREQIKGLLEKQNAELNDPFGARMLNPNAQGQLGAQMGVNEGRLAENAKVIAELQKAAGEVTIKVADAVAEINSDPAARIKAGFDVLRDSARNTIKDVDKLTARLTELNRQEAAATEAVRASRPGSSSSRGRSSSGGSTRDFTEYAEDTERRIESIRRGFEQTPQAIARMNDALATVKDLTSDIEANVAEGLDPEVALRLKTALADLKPVIWDSLNQPFNDLVEASEELRQIDELILAGRENEAEVLRRTLALEKAMGPLSEQQKAMLVDIVAEERARARAIEEQAEKRRIELDYLQSTQDNLRQTTYELLSGKGLGSIGNFFKRQMDAVMQEMADSITESIFGDFFRNEKDRILGFDKVQESSKRTAKVSNVAADALRDLAKAARGATDAMSGVAANDNSLEQQFDETFNTITVDAPKSIGRTLKSELKGVGKSIFGEEAFAKLSSTMKGVMEAAAYGQAGSGIGKSLGIKQSKLGGQIGGMIGTAIGGPIGGMIGGFIGGTIGGFFKKTPKGRVTVTDSSVGYKGAGRFRDQLMDAGSGIQGGIENIADQLGGTVGSYSVSLKRKGKKYYVNGQKFRDEQDAAEAAILAAIQNGAVKGIRAGAQRLLAAGTDLDRQLAKAAKFQAVFDELDSLKDPVGFAVRSLNREFEGLIRIFKEAGASAEEMAQLEELYGLKRTQAIEEANNRVLSSLRSFYDSITVGNDALSLRDREAMAQANFNPLRARVEAGDVTAYDDFVEAGQTLLEISRQLYGSQNGYFDILGQIQGTTRSAITSQSALATNASSIPSPFLPAPANENAPVVSAINDQSQLLLEQLTASNLTQARMLAALQAANASGQNYSTYYATAASYF